MAIREDHLQRLATIVARLPGLEISRSGGTLALSVDGKVVARVRGDADGWLAIRCDLPERDRLVASAPQVYHVSERDRAYPMILIDLDRVEDAGLADIVEKAWKHATSPKPAS